MGVTQSGYSDQFVPRSLRDSKDASRLCVKTDPARCPILYDSSFKLVNLFLKEDPTVVDLERQLWEALFEYAKLSDTRNSPLENLFSVSRDLLKFLASLTPDALDCVISSSLLSFAPTRRCQDELEMLLTNDYPRKRVNVSAMQYYWIDVVKVISTNDQNADPSSLIFGLRPSLVRQIRNETGHRAFAQMMSFNTSFQLRYSEKLAANIIYCAQKEHNSERMRDLQLLKLNQMASGSGTPILEELCKKAGIKKEA